MYQTVCDSLEQETLACGEEGFLNNLVKMSQLPASALALRKRELPAVGLLMAVTVEATEEIG